MIVLYSIIKLTKLNHNIHLVKVEQNASSTIKFVSFNELSYLIPFIFPLVTAVLR